MERRRRMHGSGIDRGSVTVTRAGRTRRTMVALAAAGVMTGGIPANMPAAGASGAPFALAGTHATGVGLGSAEIVAVDGRTLYVTNGAGVDVLDIVDPANPVLRGRIDTSDLGADPTSVAARNGLVLITVPGLVRTDPGVLAVYLDGERITVLTVGSLPDMVTFTPDGTRAVVANEGEPSSYGQADSVDPEGSISIIDTRFLSLRISAALRIRILALVPAVRTVGFSDFNVGGPRSAQLDPAVRIFGPGASVAQDLEPEFVAVDPNSRRAFVTLQENNAIAEIDLDRARVVAIRPLGHSDHSQPGRGIDASDRDSATGTGAINIANWPVMGMYQPDGVAAFRSGGRTLLVTANEGDAREYTGFVEEGRARAVADIAAVPAANDNARLGRLTVTTATPAPVNAAGKVTALHSFGSRSFSILDAATGRQVFDSGDTLERLTSTLVPANFNSNNETNSFDDRSDNKGPEPEGVAVGQVGGRTFAFVGLERLGGVMVFDVSNPRTPTFVQYLANRSFAGTTIGPDSGPEGITFVPADRSPTRRHLLVVGNETSGTVSIYSA
ncbi:MAG: choice-of-anchor I family protein [Acidimicrobiales bacterium]